MGSDKLLYLNVFGQELRVRNQKRQISIGRAPAAKDGMTRRQWSGGLRIETFEGSR